MLFIPPVSSADLESGLLQFSPPSSSSGDLLAAGYLKSGDSIVWKRRALKRSHLASIQSDGTIVTDDGVVHKTPSGAAKHLNDDKPVDGWLAWKLEESGVSLADLRKRLN